MKMVINSRREAVGKYRKYTLLAIFLRLPLFLSFSVPTVCDILCDKGLLVYGYEGNIKHINNRITIGALALEQLFLTRMKKAQEWIMLNSPSSG